MDTEQTPQARPVTTGGSTVQEWTRELAESTGSPGGGAGAGVMLAIAASLTSMVAGYTEAPETEQAEPEQAEPAHESPVEAIRSRARALRETALRLADADADASNAFGAAFRLEKGEERTRAIREASLAAARSSAELGRRAIEALDDLAWLAEHGNPALISDVVVGLGALRAALAGARTNVSFDLGSLRSTGLSLPQIHDAEPELWSAVGDLDRALARIDALTARSDDRAAPTDAAGHP
ncbi:cyclodeaminase/cyclohydrolase family protein [Herbiconiux sp. YIM B11900]|uniref:cyclodeaminase/cyclohydrolase family protein n=1 Tax=Herbiconiux sp. YIM B11900 TaxID=3404131 RepID=UPI003F849E6D